MNKRFRRLDNVLKGKKYYATGRHREAKAVFQRKGRKDLFSGSGNGYFPVQKVKASYRSWLN